MLIGRLSKPKIAISVGAVGLTAAISVAAVTLTGTAAAIAKSQIRPLSEVALPNKTKQGIAAVAEQYGIQSSDVVEVAAKGDEERRAGLYVGKDSRGDEMVSFFAPRVFTDFVAARKVTARDGGMFVSTAAEPGDDGKTGHVQLRGVVVPKVASVEIELVADGRVSAELVALTSGGHSFFTYVSDDPASFPQIVRAFDADGGKVAEWDVREDIKPPVID